MSSLLLGVLQMDKLKLLDKFHNSKRKVSFKLSEKIYLIGLINLDLKINSENESLFEDFDNISEVFLE